MSDQVKCPVIFTFEKAVKDAEQLARSLKKLKVAMRACHECPHDGECKALVDLNVLFTTAIQEVNEEWGIVGY